jgi:hypothetical protein
LNGRSNLQGISLTILGEMKEIVDIFRISLEYQKEDERSLVKGRSIDVDFQSLSANKPHAYFRKSRTAIIKGMPALA